MQSELIAGARRAQASASIVQHFWWKYGTAPQKRR
jgi:hypothetical protein